MAVVSAQGYTFHVYSVAGVESCCYVDSLDLAFDLGCIHGRVVSKSHVFISHGHVDHVQAFVAHAARRALQSMKPATYYVPSYLAPLLQQLLETSAKMQGDAPFAAKIVPLVPFQQVVLPNNLVVKAIPTVHRVPSLGFVVYKRKRRLRSDLVGVDSKEIAERRKLGEEVTEDALTPEIAYTGDTTAEVFRMSAASPEGGENSMRDLLRVKVLITEATYVDDMKTPEDAVSRGHIHLDQIVELEGLFVDVQTLLLVHFSARYSTVSLVEALERRVPASLCGKIMLGCR